MAPIFFDTHPHIERTALHAAPALASSPPVPFRRCSNILWRDTIPGARFAVRA